MNFEALFALAGASYGAGEVGEVVATVERINSAGASYHTYFDEFMTTARERADAAKAASDAGRCVTVRGIHLRAAQYYDQAHQFDITKRAEIFGGELSPRRVAVRSSPTSGRSDRR